MLRVYLAAPFADATNVRELDAKVDAIGVTVTSTWAHGASGAEDLESLSVAEVRQIAAVNDRDLLEADLLVALARDGAGGEMFAEVRLALAHRIPILWIGTRRPLSAYRDGVLRVPNLAEGMMFLSGFAEIVSAVSPFEAKKARETLWELIEDLHDDAARPCFDSKAA
jgi:hypothetical protein